MKEPYVEGAAAYDDPESSIVTRQGAGEASTGPLASWVLSKTGWRNQQTFIWADPPNLARRPMRANSSAIPGINRAATPGAGTA